MHAFSLRSGRSTLALLLLAMTLLSGWLPLAVHPAAAQAPAPVLQAQAAFDGYFKYGEWLPVWVSLENPGLDLSGEIQVRIQRSFASTVYAMPVSLPAGARKRLPVYVLPNNFSREVEVQLVAGDQVLASQRVPVQPQANINYMIGIAAAQQGALSLLKGINLPGQVRPVSLVPVALLDLPDRLEGLQSLDALVLNDVDTSTLTPDQIAALRSWVSAGGRLVFGGGAGAQTVVSGLPQDLLPILPTDTLEIETHALDPLAEFASAEPSQAGGSFLVATGEIQADSQILAGSHDLPLLLQRKVGAGWTAFVALDLSAAPFEGWSGTGAFWEALFGPDSTYPNGMPPDMSVRQLRSQAMPYSLQNMPVLDLPSVRSLFILLGVYILLVGPINFILLRRSKRLHWAWVTIPLITAVFSASAFGMGYSLRGTDVVLNKIATIELAPGGSASVTTFMGLFSPGNQVYEVNVKGGGLLSPVSGYEDPWSSPPPGTTAGEMVFIQGEQGQVRGLSVSQWSMQSFMAETSWPDFGQIEADLVIQDGAIKGTVRNKTGLILEDVVIVLGKRFSRLGNLAPGESSPVDFSWSVGQEQRFGPSLSYALFEDQFSNPGPNGPVREAEMKRSIIEAVFERGPMMGIKSSMAGSGTAGGKDLMILAWTNQAPPDIEVTGREPGQRTTALVYTRASYRLPRDGRLVLPPGILSGALVQLPQEGGFCGEPGTTGVYLANGEAVFEFRLPEEALEFDVDRLNLALWTDMGWWQAPQVAFYDWQARDWRSLDDPQQGENQVAEAGSLVGEAGQIQLRLGGQNMQGCFYVDLGVEGVASTGQGG